MPVHATDVALQRSMLDDFRAARHNDLPAPEDREDLTQAVRRVQDDRFHARDRRAHPIQQPTRRKSGRGPA